MKIILVHGIHSKEGDNNMSMLWPWLQRLLPKHEVVIHEYGFMGFWRARWANDGQARRLAALIEPGDVVVTHSNGAAITYLACRDYGACPVGVININPALDRWRTPEVHWVETIHSPGDRWVWLSQWLPGHVWGDQGRVGYRGFDDNTINHDASGFGPQMEYSGHCGLFDPERIDKWAYFLAYRIDERLDDADYMRRQALRAAVGALDPKRDTAAVAAIEQPKEKAA